MIALISFSYLKKQTNHSKLLFPQYLVEGLYQRSCNTGVKVLSDLGFLMLLLQEKKVSKASRGERGHQGQTILFLNVKKEKVSFNFQKKSY